MEIFWFVVLAIIAVVVIYGILIYNNLVSLKHQVSQAWANIDVLLKQRHDELPKLVETIQEGERLEIFLHDNPDPDSIAAGWGVCALVEECLGKPVRLIASGGIRNAMDVAKAIALGYTNVKVFTDTEA